MASERVYYHVVFSTTRGKPVFLDEEVDAAFKHVAHEIARQKGWLLLEMETMPNHAHLLLEKAPWDDLSQMVGYLKGRAARPLHAPPAPSVGHAETTPRAEGVRYCAAFMPASRAVHGALTTLARALQRTGSYEPVLRCYLA